jgi:mannose-1-phosphate guanylyltransferase/mannose-6-phosphate isomerase
MQKILPIIMCGGSGTRMWPESRESLPKQFIPLLDPLSTFQRTVLSLAAPNFERPVILTNVEYRFLVAEQLAQIGMEAEIVLEPMRRDSATAVGIAAELARHDAELAAGANLLLDIVCKIRIVDQECTSILFSLTELICFVGIPSASFLNDSDFNAKIDK